MEFLSNPNATRIYCVLAHLNADGSLMARSYKKNKENGYDATGLVDIKVYELAADHDLPQDVQDYIRHLALLNGIHREHIRKCIEAFHNDEFFFVVLPHMLSVQPGFVKVSDDDVALVCPRRALLTEREGQVALSQLAETIRLLHCHGLCVPGLSLSNVFITKTGRFVIDILGISKPLPLVGELAHWPNQGQSQFSPPEVYLELPHNPRSRDAWAVTSIVVALMTGQYLYNVPHRDDIGFRLFVAEKGLAPAFARKLTNGMLGHLTCEDLFTVVPLLKETLRFTRPLLELLSNTFALSPLERWDVEQILASEWIQRRG